MSHQGSLNANMGYSGPQNHVTGFCFGCLLCLPEMKFPYKVYFKVKVPSKQKMYWLALNLSDKAKVYNWTKKINKSSLVYNKNHSLFFKTNHSLPCACTHFIILWFVLGTVFAVVQPGPGPSVWDGITEGLTLGSVLLIFNWRYKHAQKYLFSDI